MLQSPKSDFLAADLFRFAKERGGSIAEFVLAHNEGIEKNPSKKALFTKDQKTLEIANKVLCSNEFLRNNVLQSREGESAKQIKSQIIKITDIKTSQYFDQFLAEKNKKSVAFVGGPAAEDGAVMAGLIPEFKSSCDEIFYIIDDYSKSNVSSSAKQLHARHAVPLNAEECLTGHALIPVLCKRILNKISVEEAINPHYIKVDINYKNLLKNAGIYLRNELDWVRKTLEEKQGKITDNDWGRVESLLTIKMLQITEKLTEKKLTEFRGEENISDSIHLTFSAEEDAGLRVENENFKRAGIFARELARAEIEKIFGKENPIVSAFHYPSDSNVLFDAHETNRQIAEGCGVRWMNGAMLTQVFLELENGEKKLAGIEILKDGELKFLRVSQMHTTLGYRAEYVSKFGKIKTEMTTAAGMSMNLILRKTESVRNLMAQFGNTTGQLAVTNSHWTMIAQDEEYVILRVTGGGFTGSEEYKSAYFLNTFANTIRIFGAEAISGIISTYACPRAINSSNATRWLQPAEGWVISYGKGGTGNSERNAEAAFAAMFLGFEKEIIKFYDQFALGAEIKRVFNRVRKMKKNV